MQRRTFREAQRDREISCLITGCIIFAIVGFVAAIALPEIMEAFR
jgi:hypothetical protein